MPNDFFKFKQFTVYQEQCAMKVCTDSCLFGAWIEIDDHIKSILDIGTGTGLLSLMLAQRSAAVIHAVEIDLNAYRQAIQNIKDSPWKERISLYHDDIRNLQVSDKYDMIVCNPPFYQNDMHSFQQEEKIAKHSLHLSLPELIASVNDHLHDHGKFAILLPYSRKEEFEKMAIQQGYQPSQTLSIKQTPDHNFFRFAAIFSKNIHEKCKCEEMSIKNENGDYSTQATHLLKPYYLYL
ncbi:MAG: methyltransferase [Bacteroidota bacterium]|nr:methyltransferase [Bacteroidota bacterium]